MTSAASNQNRALQAVREILFELSGFEIDQSTASTSFLELGFDSLFLIQFSTNLKRELGVEVSFRQMLEDTATFSALVDYVGEVASPDRLPTVEAAASNEIDYQETVQPQIEVMGAGANGYQNGSERVSIAATSATMPATLNQQIQQPTVPPAPQQMPVQWAAPQPLVPMAMQPQNVTNKSGLESVLAQQLQIMSMQLAVLAGHPAAPMQAPVPAPSNSVTEPTPQQIEATVTTQKNGAGLVNGSHHNDTAGHRKTILNGAASESPEPQPAASQTMKPFGAIARIQTKKSEDLMPNQQAWLTEFIARYNQMTAKSKEFTAQYQQVHADPRVVSGFKTKIKELIYPIVASRTNGCRIWDIDGNEYVDALNGFGSNFFGYANPQITQAVVDQMWRGVEIGPQCPLTGETAELICEFTGMDRVGFCNTGSEAVMGAMRIARTVTGRKLIVIFSGSYHGIFDEVIVRSTPGLRSMPAAPGIMPSTVENVLVLEYGTEESLKIIRERIDEFAAVMVEPVQSRRPDFQPREFLHELRQITAENDVPFIFDEVITGFRTAPGGAQEFFGIQADLATYGKVVGGGMHIGVVAGKAKYMDALDGGPWQYGDDSVPEVGVTYFAGTFVRHPASIAACLAALRVLKEEGPALQQRVNAQTTYLVSELKNFFRDRAVPLEVTYFSSLWRMTYAETVPYGELLFYLIREKGVHIYDGFPCFLTMAHTDEDVEIILKAIKESVGELQRAGILPLPTEEVAQTDFFAQAS